MMVLVEAGAPIDEKDDNGRNLFHAFAGVEYVRFNFSECPCI